MEDRTADERRIRFLNIIDEAEQECLACMPKRSWKNEDVIEALSDFIVTRGCPTLTPEYIRSDNRAGKPFGERVLRKLQCADEVRIPQ